jgi:hypothetical protein
MRLRTYLLATTFAAVTTAAAVSQQAAVTTQPKVPSGLSFTYDPVHGQLSANGLNVKIDPDVTAATSFTGTVTVKITIALKSTFPNGTTFPCSAIVIGGEIDTSTPTVDGGIETASGKATVNSKTKTATCNLFIPYEWTLVADPAATEGLIIAFAAAAVDPNGTTQRATIQIGGVQSLPGDGKTTKVSYSTTL